MIRHQQFFNDLKADFGHLVKSYICYTIVSRYSKAIGVIGLLSFILGYLRLKNIVCERVRARVKVKFKVPYDKG